MTIERAYYEIEGFWEEALFQDQVDRFRTVAAHVPEGARRLLDVGCGNGLFVRQLETMDGRFDLLHGVDRSAAALARAPGGRTRAAIERLPFADRAFDIVTCLEVIEHLPLATYRAGLSEVCRVASRFVLLSVPNEEDLPARQVECPSCRARFNPDYHMRRYDAAGLGALLEPFGFQAREVFFMGSKARYFLVSDILERRATGRSRGNPFPVPIPCPVCGDSLPPSAAARAAQAPRPSASVASPLRGLLKRLLRTGEDYGWVAALYERR